MAEIGHTTTFAKGDGASPEVFTALAELLGPIEGPGLSRETVDSTHMGSTDRWREFIGGLRDGGEVSLALAFDPDGANSFTALKASFNSNAAGNWKITFPDSTAWTFSALIAGLSPTIPMDDKMMLAATFRLSGKPAFMV